MKHTPKVFAQRYQAALRSHLGQKSGLDPQTVGQIGDEARSSGVTILEFAKLHERVLVTEILPGGHTRTQNEVLRKAGDFFAAAVTASGAENEDGADSARLRKAIKSLSGRTVELAAANRELGQEITRRKRMETALRKSELKLTKSLEKSEVLKEQLRGFSRKILSAQEEERKKISREMHDVIAQALIGINVRLATLKSEAGYDTKAIARNITLTQKMVTKSAEIVHQFVRELRPALLDDLGLIPALHSFMKSFTTRTGVHTHLTVFEGVEQLSAAKRTVMYRVAQEALTNVARHAQASNVEVAIHREVKSVIMEVIDDGRSFNVERFLLARCSKHLGLLGMRERVEMVGGFFGIESAPGTGTRVIARIPVSKATDRKWRIEAANSQTESKTKEP